MANTTYEDNLSTSRIFQEKEVAITENGKPFATISAERGTSLLKFQEKEADETGAQLDIRDALTQLHFEINDGGAIDIAEDYNIDLMTSDYLYDGLVPPYIWLDPVIFNNEAKLLYIKMPAEERANFVIEILDKFYRENIEYANFSRIKIYKDPLMLLEFFQSIKKGDFKKCEINDNGRYAEMQNRIKEAELSIARKPIDIEKLTTIWPILRIRELFTESELAAFYYLKNPRTETALTEQLITDYSNIYNLPFGPFLFTTAEAIAHAAVNRNFGYELTKSGKKKNDRHKSVEVKATDNGTGFKLTHRKKGSQSVITVINKDLIQSTAAMKLFCFLLAKAAQQNFNPVIKFSLQELVNIGMYSNINNARQGFKNHILAVQALQLGGEMKKGKKYIKQESGVLFYHNDIDQNIVSVWVNENFDLEFLASYYAPLPAWAFAVSDNAFEILLYIFTKARTERSTHFNVSLTLIRDKLALPTKEEYAAKGKKFNAGQFVKKPIIAAVDAINDAIKSNAVDDIKVQPHYIINDKTLDEWLNGYIEVEITGEFSDKLKEIRSNQTKIIEANTERKEAARAMVEAQKEAEKNEPEK